MPYYNPGDPGALPYTRALGVWGSGTKVLHEEMQDLDQKSVAAVNRNGDTVAGNFTWSGAHALNAAGTYAITGTVTVQSGAGGITSVAGAPPMAMNNAISSVEKLTAYGANVVLDFTLSNNHVVGTLTGNIIISASGPLDGALYTVMVTQDGTGGRTVTWGGTIIFGLLSGVADATAAASTVWLFKFTATRGLMALARNVF